MSSPRDESTTLMNRKNEDSFWFNNKILEYKLLQIIGEGSFSKVYKAQSLKNGVLVAIKCMKSLFNSLQEVKFKQEILILQFNFLG